MKITVDKLRSLDDYQRRALVPMLNLIFGFVGTRKWDSENLFNDTSFEASLDYFRQAFHGDDPDQLKTFFDYCKRPNEDMYKRFVAGSDMVVDRYMRSDLGWEKMSIDPEDIQAVALFCNPHWKKGCPWDSEWIIEDLRLVPLGTSITRNFNLAYMSCMEQDENEGNGNNA